MRRLIATLLLFPALALAPASAVAQQDIVRTAKAAGQFSTLLAAAEAAGLVGTLQGKGPLTVFAPTDAAFRKLPAGTVESLLKPENREQLRTILLYHVVSGRVPASTARTLPSAKTVEGREVQIRSEGSALRINTATVITADVNASNGVIHVIDEVLMPPTGAKTSASRAVRDLVETAIARGVPRFNEGDAAATAAIYEVAARGVLAAEGVPAAAKQRVERGLREAARTHDDSDRAWVLRRALDDAKRAFDGRAMSRDVMMSSGD